jgi:hypothetical protein
VTNQSLCQSLKAQPFLKIQHLLTAKDAADKEFQPKFAYDALYGSSFDSS